MNKLLRIIRIVVSLLAFVVLTLGLVTASWQIPLLFDWLCDVQLRWVVSLMSVTVFSAWILLTLLFGRIYCSSVCPLGTMMDLSAGARRLTLRGRRRVYRYNGPNNGLRYTMLAITALAMVGGVVLVVSILDPFSAFMRVIHDFLKPLFDILIDHARDLGASPAEASRVANVSVATTMTATFLAVSIVVIAYQSGRSLCNTICPVGTLLGFISRYAIWQIQIDTDKCTQCRRCEYACKGHCIDLDDHVVDGSRCINCFDCLTACHDEAIHYTIDRKRLSQPLMQKIKGLAAARGTETAVDASSADQSHKMCSNDKKSK
ncbi:MAG: 4Fe-4S binding protein [Bacteroides sp.]|nr:4Fe-4S binding protein [Bacteroides sp.]MCM1413011.1 4Fe-4S binding protein [Bacteroides sp.]MCM1471717.1 4Fe-4S binding protein [Bacteroides sp.]